MRTEFRDLLQCADYFKLSVNQKQKFGTKVASVSMSELVANSTGPSSFNHALADSGIISVPYEKEGINVSKYLVRSSRACSEFRKSSSACTVFVGERGKILSFTISALMHDSQIAPYQFS